TGWRAGIPYAPAGIAVDPVWLPPGAGEVSAPPAAGDSGPPRTPEPGAAPEAGGPARPGLPGSRLRSHIPHLPHDHDLDLPDIDTFRPVDPDPWPGPAQPPTPPNPPDVTDPGDSGPDPGSPEEPEEPGGPGEGAPDPGLPEEPEEPGGPGCDCPPAAPDATAPPTCPPPGNDAGAPPSDTPWWPQAPADPAQEPPPPGVSSPNAPAPQQQCPARPDTGSPGETPPGDRSPDPWSPAETGGPPRRAPQPPLPGHAGGFPAERLPGHPDSRSEGAGWPGNGTPPGGWMPPIPGSPAPAGPPSRNAHRDDGHRPPAPGPSPTLLLRPFGGLGVTVVFDPNTGALQATSVRDRPTSGIYGDLAGRQVVVYRHAGRLMARIDGREIDLDGPVAIDHTVGPQRRTGLAVTAAGVVVCVLTYRTLPPELDLGVFLRDLCADPQRRARAFA